MDNDKLKKLEFPRWVDWRQYSLAKHATSLLQLVDHLKIPNDKEVACNDATWSTLSNLLEVILVGHNWGWMVGAEIARRRPELFSKLIILNTNNLPDGEALLER